MAFKATHELLTTKFWDLRLDALHSYHQILEKNLLKRMAYVPPEKREDRPFLLSSRDGFQEKLYVGNYNRIAPYHEFEDVDQVINVVKIDGPVLRNGDGCSYGSLDMAEQIKNASDDKHVIGHIIIANTPGGSAYSKFDFEEAITYAQKKKLPVIGFVIGEACSAGYAAMALCNEIYAHGLHDIIGCIGTMMAGYMQKDGDINSVTQERYVEMVADESPEKNLAFRKMAEGDYEMVKKDLSRLCTEFQQMVLKRRPQVKPEQVKGKVYDSGDVVGTLIDGIGNFKLCIGRVQQLHKHLNT